VKKTHTTIVVVVLLTALAAINYIGDPVGEEETSKPESEPVAESAAAEDLDLEPAPEPIGPTDAPVVVEVFTEVDNACQGEVEPGAQSLAVTYAPHVCLQILPWNAEGTRERAEELGVDCMVAVALTARGEDGEPGETEVIYTAPPEMGEWTWSDVEVKVAERLLEAGVDISFAEIVDESADEDDDEQRPTP
jgi:hypothetical protein